MAQIRVINIDPALHKAFKILCAEHEITMSQKLIRLMSGAVKHAELVKAAKRIKKLPPQKD